MAHKVFSLNVEPHTVNIGDTHLAFQPEANGAQVLDAFSDLSEIQARIGTDGKDATPEDLRELNKSLRRFIKTFIMSDSLEAFNIIEQSLPDRILAGLVEWLSTVYGGTVGDGGAEARPTG